MSKNGEKVSVTIECPLGAQKRKENKIHIKPKRESPKCSSTNQTKYIRDKYAKMPCLKVKLHIEKKSNPYPNTEPKQIDALEKEKQPQGTIKGPRSEARAYPTNHSGHTRVIPFRAKSQKQRKNPEDRA